MVNIKFSICIAHDCKTFVFRETTCRQPQVAAGYGELVDETQYTSTLQIYDAQDVLLHTFEDIVPSASEIPYTKAVAEFSSTDLCGTYLLRYTVVDTEGATVGYQDLAAVFDCDILCKAEEVVNKTECGCSDCFEANAKALYEWAIYYNFGKILANNGKIEESQHALDKALSALGVKCNCP